MFVGQDQSFFSYQGTHGNEWMHIHVGTNTYVSEHFQSSDTFPVQALIFIIPVQGISSKPPMACQFLLSITLGIAVWSLQALAMCFNVVSLSKKTHDTDTICINFQMEGVKACSATVPVCLKSAKAL